MIICLFSYLKKLFNRKEQNQLNLNLQPACVLVYACVKKNEKRIK